MNKLISSLCRGSDVATFSGIEVDPGESLADTAAQSGIIDVRPFRKAEEALFHKFGTKLWALEAEPRCWERLRCPRAWEASTV